MPSPDPLPLTAAQAEQAAALWRALEGVWASGNFDAMVRHHRDGHLSVKTYNNVHIDIPPASRILLRTT